MNSGNWSKFRACKEMLPLNMLKNKALAGFIF